MGRTLVIAECGSSWDCDLSKAYRLIDAVKECGADIAKFQWTSNALAMAERRGLGASAVRMYSDYLGYPESYLAELKAHCGKVGIEFMCTVYLIDDIPVIAPLVKRFKVSAFESQWEEFNNAHRAYQKPVIISMNPGKHPYWSGGMQVNILHCISEYPTPVERLNLNKIVESEVDGLSDHTTSLLSGAVAVGCGATIIEKHVRLDSTPESNPDYPHSLEAANCRRDGWVQFAEYVHNIREAEVML